MHETFSNCDNAQWFYKQRHDAVCRQVSRFMMSFGIPVIACSQNNPHNSFNFSYHAKNIKDLNWAINNFDKLKLDYSKNNIFKFYFMHNVYRQNNWIIDDIDVFLEKIGGYKNIKNLKFYDEWLKTMNNKKILKIQNSLNEFVDSKKFLMPTKI